jgi:protein-S-isoprenylcysteine O-methyltransferase Ste14
MTWLLERARPWRILFVTINAAAVVLAVFALVDRIYIQYFLNPSTIVVPSYISVGLGAAMYVWGYYLFVGTRGVKLTARRGRTLYLAVAFTVLVVNVVLIVYGISLTDSFVG